jgi:hypothetical protein
MTHVLEVIHVQGVAHVQEAKPVDEVEAHREVVNGYQAYLNIQELKREK